jgi:NADP-dependent 3-hydroxy acid dehydrogenase YdfG
MSTTDHTTTTTAAGRGMARWHDRVAFITGATSGLGRVIALRLVDEGLRVVVTGRRGDRLDALVAEAVARGHDASRVLPQTFDVRDLDALGAAFERAVATFGGVDVMVANAGLARSPAILTGDPAAWRDMLEVNVLALAECTRLAAGDFARRAVAGHIFHVSSMAGHRVAPGAGMYSATKYAVRVITESTRRELHAVGQGSRVTAISPGLVETEFAEVLMGEDQGRALYRQLEVLQPEDIADALVWALASPPRLQVHDLLIRPTAQEH